MKRRREYICLGIFSYVNLQAFVPGGALLFGAFFTLHRELDTRVPFRSQQFVELGMDDLRARSFARWMNKVITHVATVAKLLSLIGD